MSASLYDELIEQITKEGLTEAEARTAVKRCVKHVVAVGAMSYYGPGAAIAVFLTAPGLAPAVGAAGAAIAFAKAPACSSVRQAMLRDSISFWNHEEVGF